MSVAATLRGAWLGARDPALWINVSDIVAALIALALPFSTSLVGVLSAIFVLTVAPSIAWKPLWDSLRRPASALPILFFILAGIGMLWSNAPLSERGHALAPLAKFLVLPLLIYHFERSARGMWVFKAFLASCTILMLISWLVTFYPGLALKNAERGIFVKNYIDQSQEFALCVIVLAYPIYSSVRNGSIWRAVLLTAIATNFIVNMSFVIVSRTALVTLPVMIVIFALLRLRRSTGALIIATTLLLSAAIWNVSPQLQQKIEKISTEYRLYKEENKPTSVGLRLQFWQKSLQFFTEAPILGHGTGSTRGLFERAAIGSADFATGSVIDNPHNQTLNVAVQWGSAGVILLYSMWITHFMLFRGTGMPSWIGLMVVLQNMLTSLFNSHLFDFHEGWMYVLGVGVAGGMVMRDKLTVKPT